MSHDPVDPIEGNPIDAATLLARAAGADMRMRRRRDAAVRDFLLPDTARLDDARRVRLRSLIRVAIGTIGGDLQRGAMALLAQRGAADAHAAIESVDPARIFASVEQAVATQPDIGAELLDRVALDLLADRLSIDTGMFPAEADMLIAYVESGNPVVAGRAGALMAADSVRRMPVDQPPYATDLPASLHERLVWAVAAAVRAAVVSDGGGAIDRALADAALDIVSAHEDGDHLEAAAVRFASAIDIGGNALARLLERTLADRRIALFAALLARGLGTSFEDARALLVDGEDTRLWLALRALDLPRSTIARIGYVLCEADPQRDVEAFADLLGPLMQLAPEQARAALASLLLPRHYRDAIERFGREVAA